MNNQIAAPAAPKAKTFAMACKEFFGYRPGEVFAQFAKELQALDEQDKLDLIEGFAAIGWTVVLPSANNQKLLTATSSAA